MAHTQKKRGVFKGCIIEQGLILIYYTWRLTWMRTKRPPMNARHFPTPSNISILIAFGTENGSFWSHVCHNDVCRSENNICLTNSTNTEIITAITGVPSVCISLPVFNRTDANARTMSVNPASQVTDPTATSHIGEGPLNMHPLLAQGPRGYMPPLILTSYYWRENTANMLASFV